MYDAIKKFLDEQADSDLLALGVEMNRNHDRDCTWAWRMELSEEMYMRAESAMCAHTVQAIIDAMEWAQDVKGCDYLDEDGDPVTEEDMLVRARYNLDEMSDVIYNGIYDGIPETYMAIDTDELLERLKETDEWQEEYGDEEDE